MSYQHRIFEGTIPQNHLSVNKLYTTYSYFYSKDFVFSGEYHNFWELVYVCNGEVVIETPEYKEIVSKGHAFLHSPNEKHKIRANNICCNMFIYSFDCQNEELYNIAHKPLTISPLLHNYLLTALNEGLSCLAGKNHIPIRNLPIRYCSEQIVKNALELTLIDLIRQFSPTQALLQKKSLSRHTKNNIVQEIIEYMNANIYQRFDLEQLSNHIKYSTSHICSLFRQETGLSIKAYFNKQRIDEAKKLLSNTNLSLQEISEQLNFDSVQYFSLRFKKETGLTPSQYSSYLKLQSFNHNI